MFTFSLPRGGAAVAVTALVLAGCGGSDTVTVTEHTGTTSTTASTSTTSTTASTSTTATSTTSTSASTSTTSTADASNELRLRLPSQDSVGGLNSGTPQVEPTAGNMVTSLYAAGDPAISDATTRLQTAGYSGGVLRDQRGKNPTKDITLFRIYAYRVRDAAAATAEVDSSVAEVRSSSAAPSESLSVPDVPTAKGLLLHPTAGTVKADVLYVTWVAGRDVYGMQAFARQGTNLHKAEILDLAKSLYRAWSNG
ncbi:MAG: hypothetical protein U0Y82_15365 [Thermoleophilia bacterium]